MVPVNHDIYGLRNLIRTEALRRIEAVDVVQSPVDSGWLLYGLAALQSRESALFANALDRLERWALETAGGHDRDLSPLCLCRTISGNQDVMKATMEKATGILQRAFKAKERKFNVLNDPEQVYSASLLGESLPEDIKKSLISVTRDNASGRTFRKILFCTAAARLGGEIVSVPDSQNGDDIGDVISLIWYRKCYLNENVSPLWDKLEGLLPLTQLGSCPEECRLSCKFIALLGEAASLEIGEPNPNMVFDLYPFVSDLKTLVAGHFRQGKYVSAVFEATKKLNELIQQLTGSSKAEAELVQSAMRLGNKWPVVQFNECLDEDSGKNEQAGLTLIAQGIFTGFRNPKGHKPEDHDLVQMSPYECLGQLVTIDYIWKRVASAKIVKRK